MSDAMVLRLVLLAVGIVLLAVIYITGRSRGGDRDGDAGATRRNGGAPRREPTLRELIAEADGDTDTDTETGPDPASIAVAEHRDDEHDAPLWGRRVDERFDRIVTLYVAAREGEELLGADVVVAAEKVGLVFGHMHIFHRLVDGKPELGPVFSVANMLKPGHFEMAQIAQMRTPGLSFFMTLPAPLPALDAWEMMLPAAQRMAELLGALVLDEERNALGRQRIGHIREELRAYDRKHEQDAARW